MWASAKPGKSPEVLWKAAEPLVSFGKTQQKPQGTLERSGAPCRLWQKPWGTLGRRRALCVLLQSLAKSLGPSGSQQGPLWASEKASKSPGNLWKAARAASGLW